MRAAIGGPEHAVPDTAVTLLAITALTGLPLSAQAATEGRAEPQEITIQHLRPHDARGINVFESPKKTDIEYDGFKMMIGAGFTQQYQALSHSNKADSLPTGTPVYDANELIDISNAPNNAVANLYLDAQLARGIYVANTIYLSARHHRETWVKDGFLLIDGSPYEHEMLDNLMKYLTLKIGHFEINYGDAHFRRTDNGNAMYNPLVGNLIMDAFTTEIGMEAYVRGNDLMAMVGVTTGETRGNVLNGEDHAARYLLKAGFDRQMNDDLRLRLTGSLATTEKSGSDALFQGDRGGSRYYMVLENTKANETSQAWSGRFNPGMRDKLTTWVVNPFVKFQNLELFGNIEQAKGRAANEMTDRTASQYAGEAVVRFAQDQAYVAGRYNMVKSDLPGMTNEISIDRVQIGAGLFISDNILLKGEYVKQNYKDFPSSSIFHEGEFDGVMLEGVVSF
jgi:hypothetical protein